MAKIVDITDKLTYEENPRIKVKGEEIEVNADAATILKLMGILSEQETPGPKEIIAMYELIFRPEEREKIEGLKLRFTDFTTLIYAAISLVTGDPEPGEQ